MPKVKGEHYDYTPKGIAMARNAAKREGVEVKYKKAGGEVVSGNCNKRRNSYK